MVSAEVWSLVGICFLIGITSFFSLVLVLVIIRNRKMNPYAWTSSLFSLFFVIFSILTIIVVDLWPMFYEALLYNFTFLCLIILFIRSRRRYKKFKKEKDNSSILKDAGDSDDLSEKNEKLRKLFHLSGFLLVLAYYGVIPLVAPLLKFFHEFSDNYEASNKITLFTLMAATFFVLAIDAQRILFGEEYGFRRMNFLLREKEVRSPGAQTYLFVGATSGWVIAMLFEPVNGMIAIQIPLAAVVISTFADGMAAIVGKAKGKHKIKRPFNQVKSVEGCIAGFVTALGVSLPFLIWYPNGWLLSIIAALVCLLIDYLSPPIADNLLNPIIITVVLELLALIS
ncbi:MAG: diacylglycerol/polyprenol kinase family protein [Candidatus Hodarchaeota archaeon]